MSYQRPVYQHPQQQQQHHHPQQQQQFSQHQQQQQQHYQQRFMHAPNVYVPPRASQQSFPQSEDVHAPMAFNQGYSRQTIESNHSQPQHMATMMMMDNNYNGALKHEHELKQAELDASLTFPDEEYYCANEPYGSQSQKIPADFYQDNDQDLVPGRPYYDATIRLASGDLLGDDVGVMPSQFEQRPARVYEQQQHQHQRSQLDNMAPSIHHDHHHHHHHHQQQPRPQQRHHDHRQEQHHVPSEPQSRHHKTNAELNVHPQPRSHHQQHQQHQPAYQHTLCATPDEYAAADGEFAHATNDCYETPHYPQGALAQETVQPRGRFGVQYLAQGSVHPRECERYSVEDNAQLMRGPQQADDTTQQLREPPDHHGYTVQPEQHVRQQMGMSPRKISRVSASAVTSSSGRLQMGYPPAARHQVVVANDQYPSDTNTYRIVSSSPEDSGADYGQIGQQSYSDAPFVEGVSGDQTETLSSFESSPSAPMPGSNHSQQEQSQTSSPPPLPLPPASLQRSHGQQDKQHQQRQRQHQQENYIDMRYSGTVSQDWLDMICRHMIEHMDNFGICVIDNFLGSLKGEAILREVLQLYSRRNYTSGRLVSDVRDDSGASSLAGDNKGAFAPANKVIAADPARLIRNDRVIWVDGCEDGCSEINNLIQTLCSVITNSSRLSLYTGNALDKIVINKRTKAHVACYPGNKTRYIKHVDNPNNDGRVITAIYYLNKNWSTKRDGGLLRMFPAGMDTVANIEPLFDRVLFFWSDRRNPHEVLPAFRDRFAITVWYIASDMSRA